VVRRAYPQSSPNLYLNGLGTFQVTITGAVHTSALLTIDGLTRMDKLFENRLLPYSNTREIEIRGSADRSLVVDYFRYQRDADTAGNPYLRPGDQVTVPFSDRTVTVHGSVRRPGTYILKESDTLSLLLEDYAGGFLDDADLSNAKIVRS